MYDIKENFQNLRATANEAGRKQLKFSDDAPKHEHTQTYSSVEKTMISYFENRRKKIRSVSWKMWTTIGIWYNENESEQSESDEKQKT